jgi:hypothetical protein
MKHLFNPLRNYLRGLNQEAMLSSIYHLANHIEWDRDLPEYLFQANPYRRKQKIYLGFYLWSLDTLARETLLYSQERGGRTDIDWQACAKALNLLREAEDKASAAVNDRSIFSEMTRIAHRQFHWQQYFSHDDLARYMRIYGQAGMREVIEAEYGLSVEQLFQGGFALLSTFMTYETLAPTFAEQSSKLLGFDMAALIDRFTTTIPELKPLILTEQSLDQDWAYSFNPLRSTPLLRMPNGKIRCPITGMLSRRFTDGMYFEVGKIPDALSRYLGPAYQAYVGEVLAAADDGKLQIIPEASYGTTKKPKDTVDWIIQDEDGVLFLECKVLRLGKLARSKMAPAPETDQEYRKLAKAIGQTYQTLYDAINGLYPNWTPSKRTVYPIIVTMDDWNLFSHVTQAAINEMAGSEMEKRGIDPALLKSHPYKVCHIREFERAIQVMVKVGIDPVMKGIHATERLGWQMGGYLNTDFPTEMKAYRSLFPQDRVKIMPAKLRELMQEPVS